MYSMCNYVCTVSWVLNKIIDTLNTSCFEFVFTISIKKNIWYFGPACSWATRWWSFSWWPQHVVEGGSVEVSGISAIKKDEFTWCQRSITLLTDFIWLSHVLCWCQEFYDCQSFYWWTLLCRWLETGDFSTKTSFQIQVIGQQQPLTYGSVATNITISNRTF